MDEHLHCRLAKNGLENYCITILRESQGDDNAEVKKAAQGTLDWLDKNQHAQPFEFEARKKELEAIVNSTMMKATSAAPDDGVHRNSIAFHNNTGRRCNVEVFSSQRGESGLCRCLPLCFVGCFPRSDSQRDSRSTPVHTCSLLPRACSSRDVVPRNFVPANPAAKWKVCFVEGLGGSLVDEVSDVTCEFGNVVVKLSEFAGGKALANIEFAGAAAGLGRRTSGTSQANPFASAGFGAGLIMGGGLGTTIGVAAAGGFGPSRW